MKERQRWRAEEDALLRAYVKQYGPREWHLVSHRMDVPLDRDAKSCLERWKNYLKPGIKKGSLTEEEQRLVIRLQAKHGNKWKKIAAEVPGRTAKRLGKWWEVFKEKQQREERENNKTVEPIDEGKYDQILETFAEKLVKERPNPAYIMATTANGGILHNDSSPTLPTSLSPTTAMPPWLSKSPIQNPCPTISPPSPSVTLTLSTSTTEASPLIHWRQTQKPDDTLPPSPLGFGNLPVHGSPATYGQNISSQDLLDCCKDLEESHKVLVQQKKEASWRLKRIQLQLESEKACRMWEKMEEMEAKVKALREDEITWLEKIDEEYREQIASVRQEAEAKEQKLAEQWASKHLCLRRFLEQIGGQ
ncbi:unnamed protein product [Rhodiola kirilowii]